MTASSPGPAVTPSARRFAAHASLLGTGELVARLTSFAGTLAVAHLLGPAAFGATAFTQTIMLYFAMLSDGGLTLYSQRRLIEHRDRAFELIADTLATQLVLATVAAAVLTVIAAVAPIPHATAALLLLAVPFMYTQAFSTVYALRGLENVRAAVAASILTQVVASAVAIALVAATRAPGWAVAAMWIGELVSDVLAFWALAQIVPLHGLARRAVQAVGGRSWRLLRAGAPLLIAAALYQYSTVASNVFLGLLRDDHALGIYGAAVRPLVLVPVLVAVASYALIPETIRRLEAGRSAANDFVAGVVRLTVRMALIVSVGIEVLAPVIVHVVYGPAFDAAGTVLRIAIAMIPAFVYSGVVSAAIAAHGHNRDLMRAQGVSAGLATVLLPLGAAVDGARGTAVALLVSMVTLCAALSVVGRRYLGTDTPRAVAVELCWLVPVVLVAGAAQLTGLGAPLSFLGWVVAAVGVEALRGVPTLRTFGHLRRPAGSEPVDVVAAPSGQGL